MADHRDEAFGVASERVVSEKISALEAERDRYKAALEKIRAITGEADAGWRVAIEHTYAVANKALA